MKSKTIVDHEHYGSLTVQTFPCVVSIVTKTDGLNDVGETTFALYRHESRKLRKALKRAEKSIARASG